MAERPNLPKTVAPMDTIREDNPKPLTNLGALSEDENGDGDPDTEQQKEQGANDGDTQDPGDEPSRAPTLDDKGRHVGTEGEDEEMAAEDEAKGKAGEDKGKGKALEEPGSDDPGDLEPSDELEDDSKPRYTIRFFGDTGYPACPVGNGDNPDFAMSREEEEEFLTRVRGKGRLAKSVIMRNWRQEPVKKKGEKTVFLYQWPWETPFFSEKDADDVHWLYGANHIIVVALKEEDEPGLCILRDTRTEPLANKAWLLVEWLYTPAQAKKAIENCSLSKTHKKELLTKLLTYGSADLATTQAKALLVTNHLQVIEQQAMLGPILPPTIEHSQSILGYFDLTEWKLKDIVKVKTSEFAIPRVFKDHSTYGESEPSDFDTYKLSFSSWWEDKPADWNGVLDEALSITNQGLWMSPTLGKFVALYAAAEEKARLAKKQVSKIKAQLQQAKKKLTALKAQQAKKKSKNQDVELPYSQAGPSVGHSQGSTSDDGDQGEAPEDEGMDD